MPKIALVLSGAVSLGSWEAGVVDELLHALDHLNRGRGPDERFTVDVITGASAGSMTAALVARALMLDWPAGRGAMHEAWVREIDIGRLLAGVPPNALLSKRPIREIASRHLALPSAARPAPWAPDAMKLSFTVTNMSGVDYTLPREAPPGAPDDDFVSTFFAEQRVFGLTRGERPSEEEWDGFRDTAIASGNFPGAFAPHVLPGAEELWPGHAMHPFPERCTVIDGGLFNNEPLGQAVVLARKLDSRPGHPGIEADRVFLMVDANLNGSDHDPGFDEAAELPATLARLFMVLRGEAAANDWLRARRVNNEVVWRDDLVTYLADMVRQIEVADPEDFAEQLERAADRIVDRKRAMLGDARYPPTYRARAVDRTLETFAGHTEDMGPLRTRIFGTMVFLLNSVAGLDKKQELNLNVIYTTPGETAGDRLGAFAGFLSESWREHDYRVGRRRARAELPWVLERKTDPYPPEPGVDYESETDLREVDLDHAPRDSRERLRDEALGKLERAMGDAAFGPGWLHWATRPVLRWGVKKVARSKLEEALKL